MNQASVIIPHYNTPDLLERLLLQLTESEVKDIIVVDNASQYFVNDFTKKFPDVRLIKNLYNKGFAAACNQGTLIAKSQWLLFLNPDVEIDNSYISGLVTYANANNLDACSPLSDNPDYKKPVPSFFSLLTEFTPLNRIIPQIFFRNKTLVGGTLLIKNQVLKSLGGWDERFFLWFEDSDLTKMLIENGYTYNFYKKPVKHLGGRSFVKLSKQLQRDIFFNSLEIYVRKHFALIGRSLIKIIISRFRSTKILPEINYNLVSITVPNVKRKLLNDFLETNYKHFKDQQELIIVTNALDTKLVWKYREQFSEARFIVLSKNQGFAHTVNIGLRVSSGKYLGTVNDDTILSVNWLTKLVNTFKDKVGGVNPIIIDQHKNIESVGVTVLKKGKALPITTIRQKQELTKVDALNAACVVYAKNALNKVGIYDEKFGSYLEDIDLSLRLKRKGYSNLADQNVEIIHLKHQTSKDNLFYKRWLDAKNWWLVVIKNWSISDWVGNLFEIIIERLRNIKGLFFC